MSASLDSIFNPRSVAIVGASKDEWKWGHVCLKRLIESGFKGDIYPINPTADTILGKKAYASLLRVEGHIDLAVVTLGPALVPRIVEDCAVKRVKGIVIITGGFSESGEEGKKLENEILETAQKNGMRIVGPNCIGIYISSSGLNVTGWILPQPRAGIISLIAQSGTISVQLSNSAALRGFSFRNFVGVGNETDLKFHDYIKYMRDDPNTKCIAMYIEGIKNGKEFLKEVSETTVAKPVVAFKVGRSEAGRRAAVSHTGTIVGEDAVYTSVFKKVGVVRVTDSDKLFDVAETLANLPPMKNNSIAIISDGGGPAATMCDAADSYGLKVPILSNKTKEKLRNYLPTNASITNPVDIIDISVVNYDVGIFERCARPCLEDDYVGGLVIIGPFGGYKILFSEKLAEAEEKTAHQIGVLLKEYGKPIIVQTPYARSNIKALEILREHGIPTYEAIETAARCLGALSEYGQYLHRVRKEKSI